MTKAVQSWVKPEVDPPIHNALPRGCVNWEGHRLAWPKFQPQRGVLGRWVRGCLVMGTELRDGEGFSVLGQAGGRPSHPQRAAARLRELGGPSSRMAQISAATRRSRKMGARVRRDGNGASRWRRFFSLGSSQPKTRAGRRKHIADGPKGVASRARARQRSTLPFTTRCRAVAENSASASARRLLKLNP